MFFEDVDVDLLYKAVKMQRTNERQGTASTKTRSEVKGSNRKPWRQKGTGRARHGSRKTPLWVGGGITFGPKPKNYSYNLPKKMKNKAKKMALSVRYNEGKLKLIDTIDFEKPKTRDGIDLLSRFDFEGKILIIVTSEENNLPVKKSFSNIPNVACLPTCGVNVYDILKHDELLITERAFEELEEKLS
jgi:large subunit ribosomal protein L4